jgi:hypothetical protein
MLQKINLVTIIAVFVLSIVGTNFTVRRKWRESSRVWTITTAILFILWIITCYARA